MHRMADKTLIQSVTYNATKNNAKNSVSIPGYEKDFQCIVSEVDYFVTKNIQTVACEKSGLSNAQKYCQIITTKPCKISNFKA